MPRQSRVRAKVQRQFGKQAQQYARSKVHARGSSLPVLLRLGCPRGDHLVLDVATGTGFNAFAFAPYVNKVIACDVTGGMLAQARALCVERGLTNVYFQAADAEALPYAGGVFDIAACRIAPHHFPDVPAFLREMYRVLRPGGVILVADTTSPAAGEVQEWHNRVEAMRDPSHFKNYTPAEWKFLVEEAGFAVDALHTRCRTPQVFSDWISKSGTPENVAEDLRALFRDASEPVRRAFRIVREGEDFHFSWLVAIIRGRKQAGNRPL